MLPSEDGRGRGGLAIEAPSASWGTVTRPTHKTRARLSGVVYPGQHGRSGMERGVAFVPAVPGLAPRAFMGQGEGLPVSIEPASQASAGRMPKRSLRGVSERQDAVANDRRDGTANPDPLEDVARVISHERTIHSPHKRAGKISPPQTAHGPTKSCRCHAANAAVVPATATWLPRSRRPRSIMALPPSSG